MRTWTALALLLGACATAPAEGPQWKPANPRLLTPWGRAVDPGNVWPEYPRPQLVRERWQSLNGLWQLAEAREGDAPPLGRELEERVLVPFPLESALSGVGRHMERAWYRRTFEVPDGWRGQRVLLNFGGVDWETRVWVDGSLVGEHRGGYDAFSFDVTDALRAQGPHEIVVGVFDPTDGGKQMRGKQVRNPEGIWYTPTTGIWQTVWLEPAAETHIVALDVPAAEPSWGRLELQPRLVGRADGAELRAWLLRDGREVATASASAGAALLLDVGVPRAWRTADPVLYELRVELVLGGRTVDAVRSRVGFHIATELVLAGVGMRPLAGVLDQGFWPDGLYTAPSDAALRADVELVKRLGFDVARKHVKVEPDRWYAHCDELGLMVWQDLPSSGDAKTPEEQAQFELEVTRIVRQLQNHPCIAGWVVFNEGWGQYDTARLVELVRSIDPTRPITNASGWTDDGSGDVIDVHAYPGPGAPQRERKRISVLGEFGGLGLAVPGHTWVDRSWGYQGVADSAELTERYVDLWRGVHALGKDAGLVLAIYTQLTDVETECNGLVTYDREVVKIDADAAARAHRGEFPRVDVLVATARGEGADWSYRCDDPKDARWTAPDYDDAAWKRGPGGFGTEGTPGALVRTVWDGPEIWLRRAFEMPELPAGAEPRLLVHHDEDAEIWIDGVLAARLAGYTTDYRLVRPSPAALALLKPGRHVLALHVRQTGGGQYADCGIAAVGPGPR
jgi:hypothetical protein